MTAEVGHVGSAREAVANKKIDKAALTPAEPRRVRDRGHVRYVANRPCLVCGRSPSDAHHLPFAQNRALSRRSATRLSSHYVEGTIAPSTATAMKSHGGRRSQPDRYGLKRIDP